MLHFNTFYLFFINKLISAWAGAEESVDDRARVAFLRNALVDHAGGENKIAVPGKLHLAILRLAWLLSVPGNPAVADGHAVRLRGFKADEESENPLPRFIPVRVARSSSFEKPGSILGLGGVDFHVSEFGNELFKDGVAGGPKDLKGDSAILLQRHSVLVGFSAHVQ